MLEPESAGGAPRVTNALALILALGGMLMWVYLLGGLASGTGMEALDYPPPAGKPTAPLPGR